jgi:hypothetical protein
VSYLTLPGGLPSFNKAVFSLWFIVTQDAIDNATAEANAWIAANQNNNRPVLPPLFATIPLMTFGAPGGTYNSYWREEVGPAGSGSYNISYWIGTGGPADGQDPAPGDCKFLATHPTSGECQEHTCPQSYAWGVTYAKGRPQPLDCCYIGIRVVTSDDVDPDNPDLTPSLAMKIQYGDIPTMAWLDYSNETVAMSDQDWVSFGPNQENCGTPAIICQDGTIQYYKSMATETVTKRDDSDSWYYWLYGRESIGLPKGSSIKIEADTWHHLLLSFDFSGSISANSEGASSSCKLYVALDDKNYARGDLPAHWVGNAGPATDPNAVISLSCAFAAGRTGQPEFENDACQGWGALHESDSGTGEPFLSWAPSNIPQGPLGIPATPDRQNQVRHCEMAELQIFTGVTLDTRLDTNRRVFVDADGFPVDPVNPRKGDVFEIGETPVPPAVHVLNKWPDVLLHGSGNWIKGFSVAGTDDAGNPIFGPQFTPTGTIIRYIPDPSLYGPSTAAAPAQVRLRR